MGHAFFRLILRPSMILGLFLLGCYVLLVLALDASVRKGMGLQGDAAIRHIWNLGALLFPGIIGFVCGQAINEVRHGWFSWTVPGLKRKLVRGFLVTALFTATAITVTYQVNVTGTPVIPFFLGTLLWFVIGGSIESSALTTMHRRSMLTYALALTLILFVDRITGFYSTQPVIASMVAGLAILTFLHLTFGTRTDRARLFTPTLSLLNFMNPEAKEQFMGEARLQKPPSPRAWTRSLVGSTVTGWIRAGEYENFGQHRSGWLGRTLLFVIIITFFVGGLGFQDGFEIEGSVSQGFHFIYHSVFESPAAEYPVEDNRPPFFTTYWVIGVMGWMFAFMSPIFLRSALVPLSRRQRARVAHVSGMFQMVAVSSFIALALFALGALALEFSGVEGSLRHPSFLRPLVVAMILMPLAQWLSLRYKAGCNVGSLRGIGFAVWICGVIGSAVIASWWGLKAPGWFSNLALEIAILAALLGVSQWLWRRSVHHLFLRGDLA